jgi:hypothetical protein
MKVEILSISNNWKEIKDAAMTTVGSESSAEPTSSWKRRILLAEHSPIRKLTISWRWIDIPYWVSVHIVRHKFGIEHFVKSQRSDRTGVLRDELPQGALVNHECVANAQAIIYISRKRLCSCASKETREAWQMFLDTIKDKEPELYSVCVKDCVYRGGCREYKSCGYDSKKDFEITLRKYEGKLK